MRQRSITVVQYSIILVFAVVATDQNTLSVKNGYFLGHGSNILGLQAY
jgi:hypothetical protein